MSEPVVSQRSVPGTPEMGRAAGTNGMAITALVVGIVSTIFFWGGWLFVVSTGAAVVTGVLGNRAAAAGKGQRGMATAGLVLGVVAGVLELCLLCSVGRP